MITSSPRACKRGERLGRGGFERIGNGQQAGHPAARSRRTAPSVASRASSSASRIERREIVDAALGQTAIAGRRPRLLAFDPADDASAGDRLKIARPGASGNLALAGRGDDGPGQRMFAGLLDAGGQSQQLVGGKAGGAAGRRSASACPR